MMKKIALAAALFGSAVTAGSATAEPLLYNFTATAAEYPSFSFNIDSNPSSFNMGAYSFMVNVQNYTVNGAPASSTPGFTFYTSVDGGGLNSPTTSYFGQQLFSGTLSTPTLSTGKFTLFSSNSLAIALGTLNVTSAVPEPATWAMMLVGFGMIGATARYRRRATKIAYA